MIKKITFILVLLLTSITWACNRQKNTTDKKQFQIVSYNVENLFDTIDVDGKWDEEFTPDEKKKWNTERYRKKIQMLCQVLDSVSDSKFPDVVGLIEVENITVLKDWIAKTKLAHQNYQIIHYESPDFRGIDVAMFYKTNTFEVLHKEAIPIIYPDSISIINNKKLTTRDILYVKGKIKSNNEVIHLFVNHWASKYYGAKATIPHRIHAATIVKAKVDELFSQNPKEKILLMGDFNAYPEEECLIDYLKTEVNFTKTEDNKIYNLSHYLQYQKNQSSYKYKKKWGNLDHFIVSGALLDSTNKIYTTIEQAQVYQPDFIFMTDSMFGGKRPFRTYQGKRYLGGYSDHLPISIHFFIQ